MQKIEYTLYDSFYKISTECKLFYSDHAQIPNYDYGGSGVMKKGGRKEL